MMGDPGVGAGTTRSTGETKLERVAVLGAGVMGHGIAQAAAMSGSETRLFDPDPGALDGAGERVRANLRKGFELGKVSQAQMDAALDRLSPAPDLATAVRGATMVIEAAPERLAIKRALFADCARHASPGTVLASNTSSIPIGLLQEGMPHPGAMVGMHFFNPVHLMRLAEIVRGPATAEETVDRARAAAQAMGKTVIVVNDAPGFASSRLGVALGLEAIRMVEEGVASPEDIDTAMSVGYRHPMGPLRLTDLVGLDVRLDIARSLSAGLESSRFEPPALLVRMVDEGKLGKKTGEGFYKW